MLIKWSVEFSLKKMVLLVVQGLENYHVTINSADDQIFVRGYDEFKEDEHDHKEENDLGYVSHKNGMNQ